MDNRQQIKSIIDQYTREHKIYNNIWYQLQLRYKPLLDPQENIKRRDHIRQIEQMIIEAILKNPYVIDIIPLNLADRLADQLKIELDTNHRYMGQILRQAVCIYRSKKYHANGKVEKNYQRDIGLPIINSNRYQYLDQLQDFDAKIFNQYKQEYHLRYCRTINPKDRAGMDIICHSQIQEQEKSVCNFLCNLAQQHPGLMDVSEQEILDSIKRFGYEVNDDLLLSVHNSLSNAVSIICGEAGTGKTAAIQVIHGICLNRSVSFRLCAFTGKAVMNIKSKYDFDIDTSNFTTIHSLMANLSADRVTEPHLVLIIEEASMVATGLMYELLTRFGDRKRVQIIAVGDEYQLPPIGWGNFFSCLIDSCRFTMTKLEKNYRQEKSPAGQTIVNNAHCYRADRLDRQLTWQPGCFENRSSLDLDDLILDFYSDINNYNRNQILSPWISRCNTINERCQRLLRDGDDFYDCPINDRITKRYYRGDKIIVTKNFNQQNVYNGCDGVIISLDSIMTIEYSYDSENKQREQFQYLNPNGHLVNFPYRGTVICQEGSWLIKTDQQSGPERVTVKCIVAKIMGSIYEIPFIFTKLNLDDEEDGDDSNDSIKGLTIRHINLAYCITTHKSQGSEYDRVIFDCCTGYDWRKYVPGKQANIYTAITRAKSSFIYLGEVSYLENVGIDSKTPDLLRYLLAK